MIQLAIDTYGSLDILVNNAGILRDRMIFNMAEDEWDSVIKVHLKGHFSPTRHAAEYWREKAKDAGGATYGRIINTSSEAFLMGSAGPAELRGREGRDHRAHDVGRERRSGSTASRRTRSARARGRA